MDFEDLEIVSPIRQVETIATGTAVRARGYLWRRFGRAKWRKMKGFAIVRYPDGTLWEAELHWFEAHGIGKRHLKVKRQLRQL